MLFSGRGTAEQNNRQNETRLLRSRRVFMLALHELVRCYVYRWGKGRRSPVAPRVLEVLTIFHAGGFRKQPKLCYPGWC